jgi:hypothetical protein
VPLKALLSGRVVDSLWERLAYVVLVILHDVLFLLTSMETSQQPAASIPAGLTSPVAGPGATQSTLSTASSNTASGSSATGGLGSNGIRLAGHNAEGVCLGQVLSGRVVDSLWAQSSVSIEVSKNKTSCNITRTT